MKQWSKFLLGLVITIVLAILVWKIADNIINENEYYDPAYSGDEYLDETILDKIMFDYTYLTKHSEETTRKYFEDLKTSDTNYSVKQMKELGVYGDEPMNVVLQIQDEYDELIKDLTPEIREQLDKYLLKNSLIFHYEEEKND